MNEQQHTCICGINQCRADEERVGSFGQSQIVGLVFRAEYSIFVTFSTNDHSGKKRKKMKRPCKLANSITKISLALQAKGSTNSLAGKGDGLAGKGDGLAEKGYDKKTIIVV